MVHGGAGGMNTSSGDNCEPLLDFDFGFSATGGGVEWPFESATGSEDELLSIFGFSFTGGGGGGEALFTDTDSVEVPTGKPGSGGGGGGAGMLAGDEPLTCCGSGGILMKIRASHTTSFWKRQAS